MALPDERLCGRGVDWREAARGDGFSYTKIILLVRLSLNIGHLKPN